MFTGELNHLSVFIVVCIVAYLAIYIISKAQRSYPFLSLGHFFSSATFINCVRLFPHKGHTISTVSKSLTSTIIVLIFSIQLNTPTTEWSSTTVGSFSKNALAVAAAHFRRPALDSGLDSRVHSHIINALVKWTG